MTPDHTVYATVGRGYKAGGFNAASPAGRESYGEEQTLNVDGSTLFLWTITPDLAKRAAAEGAK